MAQTPFNDIPKKLFLARMLGPALGLFLIAFFCLGPRYYQTLGSDLSQIPHSCLLRGEVVSDFQRKQCRDYWNRLLSTGSIGALPGVLILGFYFIVFGSLSSTYLNARKKIEKGKVKLGGVVTDPAQGPQDLFSWFYCLRTVIIQLPDRKQMKVYVTMDAPLPHPGQTLAVLEAEEVFGEKRYLALLYTPHVAVIRGS